jgi:NAD(P)-dependent dehydrogenase (short-subunit alcohol dehydrogenase family)
MILNIFCRSISIEVATSSGGQARSSHDERSEARGPDHRCVVRHRPGNRRAAGRPGPTVYGGVRAPATTRPPVGVELMPLDVRDEVSVKACVEEVRRRAGRIDVLVNNAGVNLVGAVEETSISQAQVLFDTNVIGVLRMMQAVLPGMRRQGAGLIVNISSILGYIPAPFMGVYASTKHALEGLSESLDHKVRAFGIRVVLIEPHYTRTNLDTSAAQSEGRIDAYASQRHRTAAVITHNTNTAPEPKFVAEAVVRSIEGPYRMRWPIGQAVLLSWLRRVAAGAVVRAQPAQGICA